MEKTQEELSRLKKEYEALNDKLKELDEDELKEVTGGITWLYEKSFDIHQADSKHGSIQDVIGEWSNEEHSK